MAQADYAPFSGEVMTWNDFGVCSRELAQTIVDDGFIPDVIVSVARGGIIPAGGLGYALDIKDLFVLNIEFYTGIGTTLPAPQLLPPVPDAANLGGKKVLIADDVADSGKTLALVKEICERFAGEVRCAVLYEKSRSLVKCEYVWKRTDEWIAFPWSAQPPVTAKQNQDKDQNQS